MSEGIKPWRRCGPFSAFKKTDRGNKVNTRTNDGGPGRLHTPVSVQGEGEGKSEGGDGEGGGDGATTESRTELGGECYQH